MPVDVPVAPEVVHALPGRLRLRLAEFAGNPRLAVGMQRALVQMPGIRSVRATPLTGSLLVHHDPALGQDVMLQRVADALEIAAGRRIQDVPRWWSLDSHEACGRLGVTPDGLSGNEAAERRRTDGANRLAPVGAPDGLQLLIRQMNSLPVLLLAGSAVVSLVAGALVDAALIAAVVATNAGIGALTERNAHRVIDSIASQGAARVLVRRDGAIEEIDPEAVVVGDVLILRPGMIVPADGRVLSSRDLGIDESALTGESLPVGKSSDVLAEPDPQLAERSNMVFSGTLVVGGSGEAVVVAVGPATELGQISTAVGGLEHRATPLQHQLSRLGSALTGISLLSAGGVIAAGLLRGQTFAQMVPVAAALAVAAIPEGLPTAATVILARGLREMQRRGVLIRHLAAVETLGSITAICFDKTGTLTRNQMTVSRIACNGVRIGVADGRFLVGGEDLEPAQSSVLTSLLRVAVLCNEIDVNGSEGAPVMNGSSTENALLAAAMQGGVDIEKVRAECPLVGREPRSERRRYMITRHSTPAGTLVAAKGNPNDILGLCAAYAEEDGAPKLAEPHRASIRRTNEEMTADGLRVLGIAFRPPAASDDALIWLGMIGLSDPLRPGMKQVIGAFQDAGIRTVMLTGDQAGTARSIAEETAIAGDPRVLDGVGNLSAAALAEAAPATDAFARITPLDKLRVVQALQDAGQVVAMAGDGSNDAPALRAADIGIAMGSGGTALARETADVLLSGDDLATVVAAVRQGRAVSANMRKSVRYLVGTNASEVILTLAAVGLGAGAPLNPAQLLWINLLTDVAIAVALGYEPPEPEIMARPPRDPAAPLLGPADYRSLGLRGSLYGASALAAHLYGLARHGGSGGGVGFTTLIGMQLLEGFAARSETMPAWAMPDNPALRASVLGLAGLQGAVSVVPATRRLLGIAAFDWIDLAVVLLGAAVPYLAVEVSKPGFAAPTRTPERDR